MINHGNCRGEVSIVEERKLEAEAEHLQVVLLKRDPPTHLGRAKQSQLHAVTFHF